ncbi:MAG: 4Fe-4S binding protein [Spirochaetales bacterium]|nr:4Fe-4S binding protein [Spirochaetales bacterium]
MVKNDDELLNIFFSDDHGGIPMLSRFHSVRLEESLCRGCTNCLKACPTEAIRVKKGKAYIIEERCVDCGACIRRCPFRAKRAHSDGLPCFEEYDFTVALPAPALYGQFPRGTAPDHVLEALIRLGFDACLEVAFAAEAVSRATRAYREAHAGEGSLISSSCPAVVRLIRNRFPDLLDRVIPIRSPMEIAARLARERYKNEGRKLGIFFISPCAAKVTATRDPLGDEDSAVDGVIGFNEIWRPLQEEVSAISREEAEVPHRSEAGFRGVSWARAEGEAEGAGLGETLAADGIDAVLEVLEALEDDRLEDIAFLELMACPGGCVGGPLTVTNPYLARARIRSIEEMDRIEENPLPSESLNSEWNHDINTGDVDLGLPLNIPPMPVFSLDDDLETAMAKMAQMDRIAEELPGLDCGSCGAPSCKALAEDVVRGYARKTDCVFLLRSRIRDLTKEMLELEEIMPPGLDKHE